VPEGRVVANRVVPTAQYVRFAAHHGFRPDFCEAADPESKGIVENLVGYAKTDLMIPGADGSGDPFTDLEAANTAVAGWCVEVNAAVHAEICAVPAERLVIERELLAALPSLRASIGRSVTRKVDRLACVRFGSARYSVPVARDHGHPPRATSPSAVTDSPVPATSPTPAAAPPDTPPRPRSPLPIDHHQRVGEGLNIRTHRPRHLRRPVDHRMITHDHDLFESGFLVPYMCPKTITGSAYAGQSVGADESACKPDPVPGRLTALRSAAIHLGLPSPAGSCGLPAGSDGPPSNACAAARLAPRGLLTLLRVGFTEPPRSPGVLVVSYTTVSPLPRAGCAGRSVLCGTVPRVAPGCR
jgi:hypothetical protein